MNIHWFKSNQLDSRTYLHWLPGGEPLLKCGA